MRHVAFACREERRDHDGPRMVAVFVEQVEADVCPDCDRRGQHEHRFGVGDLTAEEILAMNWLGRGQAFLDLRREHPSIYPTYDVALAALEAEAADDDRKARSDCGRKVA